MLLLTLCCGEVHYAAAVGALLGQLLHKDDLSGHEDGLIARRVGAATSMSIFSKIFRLLLKRRPPAGHVFARDHIVARPGRRNARLEIYAGTHVFSAVFRGPFPLPPTPALEVAALGASASPPRIGLAGQLAVVTITGVDAGGRRLEFGCPGEDLGFHQCRGGEGAGSSLACCSLICRR